MIIRLQVDDLEAAKVMLGISRSAARETVSLLEGPSSIFRTHSYPPSANPAYKDAYPVEALVDPQSHPSAYDKVLEKAIMSTYPDETLIVLNRLQEVTQQALGLESRLKAEYLQQKRSIFVTQSEVLTIGEASLLSEMKLANNDLKWRLLQRNKILVANSKAISEYQQRVLSYEKQLEEAQRERDDLLAEVCFALLILASLIAHIQKYAL